MTHEDLKIAGGDHLTSPLECRTALVIVVMMYSPSALCEEEKKEEGDTSESVRVREQGSIMEKNREE